MKIVELEEIKTALKAVDLLPAIEYGFITYSRGGAVIPPVGEMRFFDPPGEVHIKYGYLNNGKYYVIKIASGFYDNPQIGLSSSDGMMLVFSQKTGEPVGLLKDSGYLTDIRTAAAGAVVARVLAPGNVKRIGVVGTGIQARLQIEMLKQVTTCREISVMGRNRQNTIRYQQDMESKGFSVNIAEDAEQIAATCNLIITTTPATDPHFTADQIRPGTHITAVGSDMPEKQELDEALLTKADLVVADSFIQCQSRGEIFHALSRQAISYTKPVELGKILAGNRPGRTSDDQITIADLTGVAVQDIQIATAVFEQCLKQQGGDKR